MNELAALDNFNGDGSPDPQSAGWARVEHHLNAAGMLTEMAAKCDLNTAPNYRRIRQLFAAPWSKLHQ